MKMEHVMAIRWFQRGTKYVRYSDIYVHWWDGRLCHNHLRDSMYLRLGDHTRDVTTEYGRKVKRGILGEGDLKRKLEGYTWRGLPITVYSEDGVDLCPCCGKVDMHPYRGRTKEDDQRQERFEELYWAALGNLGHGRGDTHEEFQENLLRLAEGLHSSPQIHSYLCWDCERRRERWKDDLEAKKEAHEDYAREQIRLKLSAREKHNLARGETLQKDHLRNKAARSKKFFAMCSAATKIQK